MNLKPAIKDAIDDFDAHLAAGLYKAMGWTWLDDGESPSPVEIKRELRALAKCLKPNESVEWGGLCVRHEHNEVSVSFNAVRGFGLCE